ncbi:TonB-dependent receptor [Pelagicoccus sp. SDUM812005]|uniref:TonB-dependent receptor n=1 Tax=Pelagicoccus sp. SDUM812005 TaxID=3041257 RepID=UPI00280DE5A5|nr:TonB-dependent receptor [Pelagicoccus sp. SDUM812005]MDQ8183472.1 TonB-dependent receptor [Pelagicoccus sp. SDUM812005]
MKKLVHPSLFNRTQLSRFALVSSALLSPLAFGQADDGIFELEAYTVDGIRGSITKAQEIKRYSPEFVDAISAEDIGKFPDQNLAESLQRISGVTITRNRGEGQNVSVRGLPSDFTRVQFNGHTLPSPNGSRSFDFTIIPSAFISGLEVYKSPAADLEEGGISATVKVVTPRPIDVGKRLFSATVSGVNEENSGSTDPKVSFLFSDVFSEGKFGFTFGAHYDKRSLETHQFQAFGAELGNESSRGPTPQIDYNLDGDFEDSVRFNHATNYAAAPETRERKTFLATGQWRPSEETDFWIETMMSEFDVEGELPLNSFRWTNIRGEVTDSNIVASPMTGDSADGFADYLEVDGVDWRSNSRQNSYTDDLLTVAIGGNREMGDWVIEAEASFSDSERLQTNLAHATIGRAHASYDVRDDIGAIPAIRYASGFDPADATAFRGIGVNGNLDRAIRDENTDFRIDVDRDLDIGFLGDTSLSKLEFGAKYSTREQFSGARRLSVSGQAVANLLGEAFDPSIEGGSYDASRFMVLNTPSDFFGGYDGPINFPTSYLASNTSALFEEVTLDQLIEAGSISEGGPGQYTVDEDVTAVYVKLNFEDAQKNLSGNFGIRYVTTDQTSSGFFPDVSTLSFNQGGAVTNVESSNSSMSRSYSEILPSFNMKYYISDDVLLRFAAARVMSRPSLSILSPATSYNVNVRSISSSNPFVEPFLADQFDLSLEWYHGDAGLFTISPFVKKIDSFIVSATNKEQVSYFDETEGVQKTAEFTRFQPDNGAGSDLFGFEVAWTRPLDFIAEGLGFQANYTAVTADDVQASEDGPFLPITGLSENSYNIVTYYENDKLGLRLSYNYRDDFIVSNASYFGDGEFTEAYSQLDLSADYKLNENVTLFLEGLNLTEETLSQVNSFGLLRNLEDNGRRLVFGVRAKL